MEKDASMLQVAEISSRMKPHKLAFAGLGRVLG